MDFLVKTPFYRNIIDIGEKINTEQIYQNYSDYDLFCLKTKLQTILSSNGSSDHITMLSVPINNRMVITVNLLRYGKYVKLSREDIAYLQKITDTSLGSYPKHCILYSLDNHRLKYERSWMISVLSYLNIPIEYNPFIMNNNIYVEFDSNSLYYDLYNMLVNNIEKQFNTFYKIGTVVCSEKMAIDWNLTLVPNLIAPAEISLANIVSYALHSDKWADQSTKELTKMTNFDRIADQSMLESTGHTGLYMATWKDRRFAQDITQFLSRLHSGMIELSIGNNFVNQYQICLKFNKLNIVPKINNDKIYLPASTLKEARKLASLVEKAKFTSQGKVMVIQVGAFDMFDQYKNIALDLWPNSNASISLTSDQIHPYKIYIKIPYTEDLLKSMSKVNAIFEKQQVKSKYELPVRSSTRKSTKDVTKT